MRWLIQYIRQCLCRHEYEKEEQWCEGTSCNGHKVSLLCLKCGFHKSFWKWW